MRSIPHELYVAVIVHISVTAVAYVNVNKYTLACYENLFVMMRSPCERLGVPTTLPDPDKDKQKRRDVWMHGLHLYRIWEVIT